MMRTAQFCCKFAIAKVPCCISRVFVVVCFVVYKTQKKKKNCLHYLENHQTGS